MNVGIIRCDSHSVSCPAAGCLEAVREKNASFSSYPEVKLVGLDTCGGCDRGKADKITGKAERLKELGADAIHLGNCMVGPCPYKDTFSQAIEEVGLEVVHGTH